ncbi:MAG: hypothetical protein QW057_10495 [Candidatus Bathyarchaeia archaeon]
MPDRPVAIPESMDVKRIIGHALNLLLSHDLASEYLTDASRRRPERRTRRTAASTEAGPEL